MCARRRLWKTARLWAAWRSLSYENDVLATSRQRPGAAVDRNQNTVLMASALHVRYAAISEASTRRVPLNARRPCIVT